MKTILSIILFFGITTTPSSKKNVLPYGILISKADLIVHGKISALSAENKYEFIISDFVKGKSDKIIRVNMWEEWTCDFRIEKPTIGQEIILFLIKNKSNEYDIINGSTGELFVNENGSVTTFQDFEFPKVDELKKGIKLFDTAFKYHGSLYGYEENQYFERLVSSSKIQTYINQNEFFAAAVREISNYDIR